MTRFHLNRFNHLSRRQLRTVHLSGEENLFKSSQSTNKLEKATAQKTFKHSWKNVWEMKFIFSFLFSLRFYLYLVASDFQSQVKISSLKIRSLRPIVVCELSPCLRNHFSFFSFLFYVSHSWSDFDVKIFVFISQSLLFSSFILCLVL